jgi:hypothetical protein
MCKIDGVARGKLKFLQTNLFEKSTCLPPAYLLVLAEIFFDPEDGGDMFP